MLETALTRSRARFHPRKRDWRLLEEDLSGVRQLDTVRVAHEEECAERLLERGHVTTYNRAAHEEMLRSAPKAQATRQVDKLVKILEIHHITRIGFDLSFEVS